MAFKLKYKNIKEIIDNLYNASKMHKKDAKRLEKHVSMMEESPLNKKPGLWANIHARRKAGKPRLKPGDKNYPKTLDIE